MTGRALKPSETEQVSPLTSLTRRTGQTRAADCERLVADIVTNHDGTVNEKFPGRSNFCFWAASPAATPGIELSNLLVAARFCCLTNQMPNKL